MMASQFTQSLMLFVRHVAFEYYQIFCTYLHSVTNTIRNTIYTTLDSILCGSGTCGVIYIDTAKLEGVERLVQSDASGERVSEATRRRIRPEKAHVQRLD